METGYQYTSGDSAGVKVSHTVSEGMVMSYSGFLTCLLEVVIEWQIFTQGNISPHVHIGKKN